MCSTTSMKNYFYPRPPRGGRRISMPIWTMKFNFYPRPPRGGRRKAIPCWQSRSRFLSTPSARRATRRSWQGVQLRSISIHALREEGDTSPRRRGPAASYFYPRPPRGGRPDDSFAKLKEYIFLSTPSARRATPTAVRSGSVTSYFYPRPPRGGRLCGHSAAGGGPFYPRPPRGGRLKLFSSYFQS